METLLSKELMNDAGALQRFKEKVRARVEEVADGVKYGGYVLIDFERKMPIGEEIVTTPEYVRLLHFEGKVE